MKLFKEELDHRRDRNRNYKFGGWEGLVIKILICIGLFLAIKGFSEKNVENMLWFFGAKKPAPVGAISISPANVGRGDLLSATYGCNGRYGDRPYGGVTLCVAIPQYTLSIYW